LAAWFTWKHAMELHHQPQCCLDAALVRQQADAAGGRVQCPQPSDAEHVLLALCVKPHGSQSAVRSGHELYGSPSVPFHGALRLMVTTRCRAALRCPAWIARQSLDDKNDAPVAATRRSHPFRLGRDEVPGRALQRLETRLDAGFFSSWCDAAGTRV